MCCVYCSLSCIITHFDRKTVLDYLNLTEREAVEFHKQKHFHRNTFAESVYGLQVSTMFGLVISMTSGSGLDCGSIWDLTHILDNCNGSRYGGQIEIPSLLGVIILKLPENGTVCRILFRISFFVLMFIRCSTHHPKRPWLGDVCSCKYPYKHPTHS